MDFAASNNNKKDSFPTIQNQIIAICGYGNQGRPQALNLRDNGLNVIIGSRDGKSFDLAVSDGFQPVSITEAIQESDIALLSLPDVLMAQIYLDEIDDHLKTGQTLIFAHGFAIVYGLIKPKDDTNIVLVSPKAAGVGVRRNFEQKIGIPALVGIHQDPSGNSSSVANDFARAIGASLILETSLRNETETDLFGEQAVLCGGIPELIRAGIDTLVDAGYPAELAYFECLHETKLVVDLIVERGISGMRSAISDTAAWGGLISGPRIVDESVRSRMRAILKEIRDESFAQKWILESADRKTFTSLSNSEAQHLSEPIGEKLRNQIFRANQS